jgi:hypothetical protein
LLLRQVAVTLLPLQRQNNFTCICYIAAVTEANKIFEVTSLPLLAVNNSVDLVCYSTVTKPNSFLSKGRYKIYKYPTVPAAFFGQNSIKIFKIRRAFNIKLKNANNIRTVTVRRVFFKFLKASIADLITLLSS